MLEDKAVNNPMFRKANCFTSASSANRFYGLFLRHRSGKPSTTIHKLVAKGFV